jgi:hypothetical protein
MASVALGIFAALQRSRAMHQNKARHSLPRRFRDNFIGAVEAVGRWSGSRREPECPFALTEPQREIARFRTNGVVRRPPSVSVISAAAGFKPPN